MNVNKNSYWRKANYAVNVKSNMPQCLPQCIWYMLNILASKAIFLNILRNYFIDICCYCGIIVFTINTTIAGDSYGKLQGCQNQSPKGVWDTKSTIKERNRRIVRAKRIFRFSRYSAGQIRDATPCKGRRLVGDTCSTDIWILARRLLSGKDCFRARWIPWTDSQTPWPKTCPQTNRYRLKLYRSAAFPRQNHFYYGTGYDGSKTIQAFRSSSQYRTSIDSPAKKRAVEGIGDDWINTEWTSRYEQLRREASQDYLSYQGGWGLALFMRQGMAAWMHAWPKPHTSGSNSARHQIFNASSDHQKLPQSLRTQVTMVLADMILNQSYKEAIL
jgi:hypothetical protein